MHARLRSLVAAVVTVGVNAAGLVALSPPAHAEDPGQLQVLVSEDVGYSGLTLGDLFWHDGTIYAIRTGTPAPTAIAAYDDSISSSAPAITTPIPPSWSSDTHWQSNRDAFAVAPDGSIYVRAPYRNRFGGGGDPQALGWGIGRLAPDGTITPPEVPPGGEPYDDLQLGGPSESIDLDRAGTGFVLGGELFSTNRGSIAGAVARIPLPVPADQQLGAEILMSNSAYDGTTESYRQPPFTAEDPVAATTHAWTGAIYDVDAKGRYVYVRESWWIHRVDLQTNGIVTLCCRQPAGWDPPPPVEGGKVMDAHLEIQGGPVADRAGNLFISIGETMRNRDVTSEIWQIRPDGTLHHVAGSHAATDAPTTGADPTAVQLWNVHDLALDPDGNLYVSTNESPYDPRQILKLHGVAAPDVAPGAPTNLAVSADDGALDLTWQAPADDGGLPVAGYTVRAHPHGVAGSAQDIVVTVSEKSARLTGLANQTTYDLSVLATNGRGDGPAATATGTPRASFASLTATPTQASAGDSVVLDATASGVPAGSTFTFYCDQRYNVTVPATGRTATCVYERGSNDQGYTAKVAITGPGGAGPWTATANVQVSDPPGTVEGSEAFTTASPDAEATAASDGSLNSTTCGAGSANATCLEVGGARIVLAAAPGTLRPGSTVRIHQGDQSALQQELGNDVDVQGGFAVVWADAQGRKYDLEQPLMVTITPSASPQGRLRAQALWDAGAMFQQWGQAFADGAAAVGNTIGSGLSWAGNAISRWWASAVQSMSRPNGARVNDVYTCSSILTLTAAGKYRCDGTVTKWTGVQTDRIAAFDAGGKVVSAGGANVVAAGGMNVVSAGGANVVSAGGANLNVTLGSNSVISAGGGNVVSAGGMNVISAGGANVVSAGGGNVISAGGANLAGGAVALSMSLTRDPGFVFSKPTDTTPPTVSATLSPPVPAGGIYPYGTTVTAQIAATPSTGKQITRVSYEVTGDDVVGYTVREGATASVVINESGTSALSFGAADDQLVESAPQSLTVKIAAPAAPTAPTGVSASARADRTSADVAWTAPSDTGDKALTAYVVQVEDLGRLTEAGGQAAPRDVVVEPGSLSTVITGLAKGHRYRFGVLARSDAGDSSATLAPPIVTAVAPGPASGLSTVPGNGRVALAWSAPIDDGGSPVTGYLVERAAAQAGPWTSLGRVSDTKLDDAGVTNGRTYYYRVSATNAVGDSAASASVSATPAAPPVTPPGTPPAAPAAQSIEFAQPAAMQYGDSPTALTATASSGLPVTLTSLTPTVCTVAGTQLRPLAAGSCTVEATQAGNGSYAAASGAQRTVAIAKAPLTVTASAATMVKRGKVPAVGPSYGGFRNGDTIRALSSRATCKADAKKRVTTCSGASAANYDIAFVPGRLKVSKSTHAFVSTSVLNVLSGESVSLPILVDGKPTAKVKVKGAPAWLKVKSKRGTKVVLSGRAGGPETRRIALKASTKKGAVARQVVTIVVW